MAYWIAAGAPREKLVMGLATYARSFLMAASDLNLPGSPFSTGMGGRPGPITRNEGIMAYYEVGESPTKVLKYLSSLINIKC